MLNLLTPYLEVSLPLTLLIVSILLSKSLWADRYLAKTRYYIWLIIALRLLIPFNLPTMEKENKPVQIDINDVVVYDIAPNVIQPPAQDNSEIYTESIDNIVTENNVTQNKPVSDMVIPSVEVAETAKAITFSDILCCIWLRGSILFAVYYSIQYFIINRQFRRYSLPDWESRKAVAKLSEEYNIKKILPVYHCSYITSPIIVGILKPKIYIPDFEIDENLLKMMLSHELVHYKRRDILYKLIMLSACCVHWFNPFVWLMNKQANRDIEISCDDEVIKGKDKDFRRIYSDSIMSVVKKAGYKKPVLSTGFVNDKETLVNRFKNIYDTKLKKAGKPFIAVVMCLSIISSLFVACNTQNTPKEIPQQAMDFMQFYCNYKSDTDYWNEENFSMGFSFLRHMDVPIEKYIDFYHNDGSVGAYTLPYSTTLDIYQFIMADKFPDEWVNTDKIYVNNYSGEWSGMDCRLEENYVEFTDENHFKADFVRYYQGYAYDLVTFEMEKQIIDYIPRDLTGCFNTGDEIWRIKSVNSSALPVKEPETIEIHTVDDFINFTEDINTNGYDRNGNTYLLCADLDFKGLKISPVGTLPDLNIGVGNLRTGGFAANFDGQGHTISNFIIEYGPDQLNDGSYKPVGLFASLKNNCYIQNLNIENGVVRPVEDVRSSFIGILVGRSCGIIQNCNVSGSVVGQQAVGGLAGDLGGYFNPETYELMPGSLVKNCTVNATVDGYGEVGTFAGCIRHITVENCKASGKAIGTPNYDYYNFSWSEPIWRVGGFSGSAICADIHGCYTESLLEILDTARNVGCFSATCESGSMINCTYNPVYTGKWEAVDYIHNSAVDVKPIK